MKSVFDAASVLWLSDCLTVLPTLESASVDMVLADLPYGMTDCHWDSHIDLAALWAGLERVVKPKSAIVFTASQPFSSILYASKPSWFKYEWIWEKNAGSNFGTVKFQPMREHESVLVFGKGSVRYYPIMEPRAPSGLSRVQYDVNYDSQAEAYQNGALGGQITSKRPDLRYPRSIQKFNRERGLHPTQKPVALCEYMIKTYTERGDTVLDPCMGSGTTGVAAIQTGRKFIGIEKDERHYDTAVKRLRESTELIA